jgi:hypothetical protein
MGLELKSSTDILRAPGTNIGNIGVKASELKKAQEALTNHAKYLTRPELDQVGLGQIFDEIQATLLNVKSQETAAKVVGTRLENEQRAVKQVNDILVRFEQERSTNHEVAGSTQYKVDKALAALELALESKDTSGKYVWGGNDSGTNPMFRIDANGNSLKTSLVNESNVVKGLVTNNYSYTVPSNAKVTVSSQHKVNESLIYPGHEAIAKAIAYLNMMKENANAKDANLPVVYDGVKLDAAQRDQREARGELKIQIDFEVQKVKESFGVNGIDTKAAADKNSELFSANIVQRTDDVRKLILTLAALISISSLDGKISDALANLRV